MFNLADVFLALAHRFPDRPAVESAEFNASFADLFLRARKFATVLASAGVTPGERLGIALSSNAETLVAMLGAWIMGATPLVADFRSRGPEREKLVAALKLRLYVEDRAAPGGGTYPALRLEAGWAQAVEPADATARPYAGTDVAAIGISSGTSGLPQPVELTHECLFLRYALARSSAQWQPGGRFIVSAPLAFSATRKHVLSRLLDGGTVIFPSLMVSAAELARLVVSSRADAMLTVPAVARGLIDLAPKDGLLFPSLGYLMCCGAPMTPQEKVDCLTRLSSGFVQNYGSTMAGMITVLASHEVADHSESVGRPMDQVLVEIVDDEGRALPRGDVGVIRVRTPGVARELVLEGLEARSSDLVVDGWIYPGDIGRLDREGFLSIVGRTSDVIIRGGVNVYPSEIEAVLVSHPAVREAAVVGWPDRVLGEEIAAFVTLSSPVNPRELVIYCAGKLHPDKHPRQVFPIDEMPRNANGKLVRRDLLARLPDRPST